jgi:formate hydrogenlyase subunit 4
VTAALVVAHALALLVLPILALGVINRTKARWAGRQGPGLWQVASDLRRLLRKRPVYSATTTAFVRLGPIALLATTLAAGVMAPLISGWAPVSFPFDFVAFAYLLGLGRLLLMLAALDTGSAFEGMGASREATYAALIEPAFFVCLGALCASATGERSLAALLAPPDALTLEAVLARACIIAALFVLLQVEAARVPIDDPTTHLELTMIHEVMVLDHAGPDLAAIQYAAAVKLTLWAGLIAALLNPLSAATRPGLAAVTSLLLILGVAVVTGLVESLVARLRLSAVPRYALGALLASAAALGLLLAGRA